MKGVSVYSTGTLTCDGVIHPGIQDKMEIGFSD